MKENIDIDALRPDSEIRYDRDIIGNKWILLITAIIYTKEEIRFSEIQKEIPEISKKVLSDALSTMVEDGVLRKESLSVTPPCVRYSLTDLGLSFIPMIQLLIDWGKRNVAAFKNHRQQQED